ncbi:MAG: hypothetical protein OXC37_02090 [Bdellovibrionaceae bacterium]|nr:hypothetical protein [Pseudobdellovibrionaceae bacterium]
MFFKLEDYFKDKKKIYDHYISHPLELEKILKTGSEKVRDEAHDFLTKVKKTVGLLK